MQGNVLFASFFVYLYALELEEGKNFFLLKINK